MLICPALRVARAKTQQPCSRRSQKWIPRFSFHISTISSMRSSDQKLQTRWESLEVLTTLVPLASKSCDKALADAETALFDEENGFVRLAALRFLCKLGATAMRSEKVWPLLDEAIQCYHGDYEYQDMLIALIGFSEGKIAPSVERGP